MFLPSHYHNFARIVTKTRCKNRCQVPVAVVITEIRCHEIDQRDVVLEETYGYSRLDL